MSKTCNFFRWLKGRLNPFILTPHHMRIQRNNFKGIFRTHDSLHSPPKLRLKFPTDVILVRTHTILHSVCQPLCSVCKRNLQQNSVIHLDGL